MSKAEKLLLSRIEAAELLGVSGVHLDTLRKLGKGPRPTFLGNRIMFSWPSLREYAEKGSAVSA